ncbi:glycosyl transferase family 2 [Jatrophihabitans sp. GAS493]|uniref:glycosyltransferase n=1 Tax=Jatrophihabitans sp. GAS493 TaxID=1907575 RepID=UPI000BB74FF3|nr:glycosyltransferase [Jatrophihabitans sp. GAS493]SOD70684.1 glycosyl transferase family 2 [Jatrophihabitans sp. GAS493]
MGSGREAAGRAEPRIAACLIVRDEAERLPACLASLHGVVDEVIVHDTGSRDSSREVAAGCGATVIAGRWLDDFARARNVALDAATAEWILAVDADETLQVDPAALTAALQVADEVDAFAVEIRSRGGADSRGLDARAEVKLFRRGGLRYRGRVHERLERADAKPLTVRLLPPQTLRYQHSGYQDAAVATAKAVRNARLARLELDELLADPDPQPADVARAALDLGRSELGAGQFEAAAGALRMARAQPEELMEWAWATDFLARLALRTGDPQEVLRLADELAATELADEYSSWLKAQAFGLLGRAPECLQQLDTITSLHDLAGRELAFGQVRELRALAEANRDEAESELH